MKHKFIHEALFFPDEGILVIGDLHIGYDLMLQQAGIQTPEKQVEEIINRLKITFKEIEEKGHDLKKIIFLGDIKHSFSFEFQEKKDFRKILEFLETKVEKENIILIKGNHDTIDYTFQGRLKPFYVHEEIAFLHGHELYSEVLDKSIKTLVLGHLHPSVTLEENPGIKKGTYKCFLRGKFKGKNIFILPSFLRIIGGSSINNYSAFENNKEFFIIPKKSLMKFDVHVVGEDKTYEFGKVKDFV